MMKMLRSSVWAIYLLVSAPGAFPQADKSQKLPESYAQVLLSVEGMT